MSNAGQDMDRLFREKRPEFHARWEALSEEKRTDCIEFWNEFQEMCMAEGLPMTEKCIKGMAYLAQIEATISDAFASEVALAVAETFRAIEIQCLATELFNEVTGINETMRERQN